MVNVMVYGRHFPKEVVRAGQHISRLRVFLMWWSKVGRKKCSDKM